MYSQIASQTALGRCRNQRFFTNKKLCHFCTTINSWCIIINSVGGNSFMTPGDFESRVPGHEVLFIGKVVIEARHCVVCLKVSLMVSAFTQPKWCLYLSKSGVFTGLREWCGRKYSHGEDFMHIT